MKLSVIIPVYNEFRTIEELIKKVSSLNLDLQIIVIDDFSTDGTRDIILKKCNHLIQEIMIHLLREVFMHMNQFWSL